MENLEGIKVGDEVIHSHSGWGQHWTRHKVEKVGKLHITVNGEKFRLYGSSVGYRNGSIFRFDQAQWDEYMQKQNDNKAVRRLDSQRWGTVAMEKVHRICAILDEPEVAPPDASVAT